jgi:hypothetical protein
MVLFGFDSEEDSILFSISNLVCVAYSKEGVSRSVSGVNEVEWMGTDDLVKISPSYPTLKLVMSSLVHPLKSTLKNVDRNVCFLEVMRLTEVLRIGCDWCSLINGIVETSKQNIIKHPMLAKKIDSEKLSFFDRYLDFCLINRRCMPSHSEICNWCNDTFGYKTSVMLLFSRIYLKLELIELRFCPFKRSKSTYYRNKDARYLPPTDEMLYQIGKILVTSETITCNNCPRIINENWKHGHSNKQSIFQPLLLYIIRNVDSICPPTFL